MAQVVWLCNNNVVRQDLVFFSNSLSKGCDILSTSAFLCTKVMSKKIKLGLFSKTCSADNFSFSLTIWHEESFDVTLPTEYYVY